MKALHANTIPPEIFRDHERLPFFLAGATADFAVANSGKYALVYGMFENLEQLCNKTGGPGKIFSFQDIPHNCRGYITHVVAKISVAEVMKVIESA